MAQSAIAKFALADKEVSPTAKQASLTSLGLKVHTSLRIRNFTFASAKTSHTLTKRTTALR